MNIKEIGSMRKAIIILLLSYKIFSQEENGISFNDIILEKGQNTHYEEISVTKGFFKEKAYEYTSQAICFFSNGNEEKIDIGKKPINIKLIGFKVQEYPSATSMLFGEKDTHFIIMNFEITELKGKKIFYSLPLLARDGDHANVTDIPIFNLVKLERAIINIKTIQSKTKNDKKLWDLLNNNEVNKGIDLLEGYNPTIGQVSNIMKGIFEHIILSNEDKVIQDHTFSIGLDSSKIKKGKYAIIQANSQLQDDTERGKNLRFYNGNNLIKYRGEPLKLNYLVIQVY